LAPIASTGRPRTECQKAQYSPSLTNRIESLGFTV
jgi:hypothetical protein